MLAVLLCASAARSGEKPPDADVAAARAHARRGLSLYELGKYDEALAELERAYQKKAAPGLLFNLAQCHRQLGHLDDAARLYRSFLRTDPPGPIARQARELLDKVERARTAAAAKSPPAQQPAPPAAVALQPEIASAAPQGAAKAHRNWPWMAAGGVAAVALAGGIVEALASRSATNQLAQLHRDTPNVDPATDQSLRNDAASKYSRSKALYIASAVAAAAGIGLYFAF